MTYPTDDSHTIEDDPYEVDEERPRRKLLPWILVVAALVGTGCGSAILWQTLGGRLPFSTTTIASAEKPSGQGDLAALRQEITGSIQSTQQLLAAQQAEIKRLSEQVAVLSGKLDLLQRPVASAQAAIPAPAPKKKPEAAKPVAAKPSDLKPAEAKPNNGPISTGGAPLPSYR